MRASKTLSEQKRLLEKSSSRKTFQKTKIDSASLIVLRDDSSFITRLTDNFSKLSLVFDFDPQLFSSTVYQRHVRGTLKEHILRQRTQLNEPERYSGYRVFIFGQDDDTRSWFINMVDQLYPQACSMKELAMCAQILADRCLSFIRTQATSISTLKKTTGVILLDRIPISSGDPVPSEVLQSLSKILTELKDKNVWKQWNAIEIAKVK